MIHSLSAALAPSLLGAILLSAPTAAAQLPAPSTAPLLRDHPGAIDPIAGLDDSLVFSRAVDPDLDRLAGLHPAGGDVVAIELRPGLAYRLRFEHRAVFAEQDTVTWLGSIEGLPRSRFALAICRGRVAATF